MDYTVTIGLIPIRRNMPGPRRTGIFNPDYAIGKSASARHQGSVKYIPGLTMDEL